MSVLEETVTNTSVNSPVKAKAGESFLTRFLKLLCSIPLGIVLLILLALACMIGMLIMQQTVEGFDNYYAELTPSQRLLFGSLGFFDIYHSWYFNTLLFLLSLNIILASIDRFPKTWAVVSKPKLDPPLRWLRDQKQTDSFSLQGTRKEIANTISQACRKVGWRKTVITEKGDRTFVFAESGAWNRLGAYAVHVGLLTIFLGGFLTAQFGHTGQMPLTPGQTSNQIFETVFDLDQIKQVTKPLPFEVSCTDIQQKLIRKEGSLSASNTIDWLTRIKIKDETGTREATVQMNRPFDYRGYRFFQASFSSIASARTIILRLTPDNGGATQDITIGRNDAATLADGTKIKFANFRSNFSSSGEDSNEDAGSYLNPAAILQVTPPNESPQNAYAFGPQLANIPIAKKPIAGYTFQLIDFEKASEQHILSVQRDPGATVVYIGFGLLCLTLVAVFFFSYQRVWTVIEETSENNFNVVIGGNANRNQAAFGDRFNRFATILRGQNKETKSL